jgi:pyrroloquinoline quinone biosynthesis protein B
VRVCVLGISAGGGLPQWNCRCQNCLHVRSLAVDKFYHSHASVAVSASGHSWCIINPTPDVTNQIERFACLQPRQGRRSTPIRSVLLTDGELDHTLGLLSLRQGSDLDVYAPDIVVNILSTDFPVKRVVSSYASHKWIKLTDGQQIELEDEALKVTSIAVGTKLPRYAIGQKSAKNATFAYFLEDTISSKTLLYAPSVQLWTEAFDQAARQADCIMIDGTFWTDDELVKLGISERTASDMGHLSLSGQEGILSKLSALPATESFLVHINNTNRILINDSEESRLLQEHGIGLAPANTEILV